MSSPSPSAPPPVAISPRSSTWGDPGEEPGTAARRLQPGYGCSPDIATHCPCPPLGAGAERRRRGRGGGPAEGYGYPYRGAGGVDAGGERMGIPLRSAGWVVREKGLRMLLTPSCAAARGCITRWRVS